jgi:tRNA threonylcarbamoyladenosine biosynthesis protein TsaE
VSKELRAWKKVYEGDLESIVYEMKEFLEEDPSLLLLTGDLGAGKTTFVRAFVRYFENENGDLTFSQVQSPTYSIVNEWGPILHADFYRLKSPEELIHLELPLYLEDKQYFLLEWGKEFESSLNDFLPEEFKRYELVIEMNQAKENEENPSRNYFLKILS